MTNIRQKADTLLANARERGTRAMGMTILPPGLDHFTVYVGLLSSAIELGKLISSEERDLKVIQSHYDIEMSGVAAAFREVEAAMLADFQRDTSLKTKTFESINLLIEAGQYEIASEFHKRLMDGFQRSALATIIEHRNLIAKEGGSRLWMKNTG